MLWRSDIMAVKDHHSIKDLIDTGMVTFFSQPSSFTGEDVAELHIHSSPAVISALYKQLSCISNVRLAEPGEFTKRALLNGKLNLIQVEGLADLLAAETEAQRRLAQRQLDGSLGKKFDEWRGEIIKMMAMTEAWIDFSEDEQIENDTIEQVIRMAKGMIEQIQQQISLNKINEIIKDGYKIALCGPPNAGKSSILNKLAKRDAAIVSPIAGTTRDVLQVNFKVNDQIVILHDTAGIRDNSNDIIEQEGINRAKITAHNADHVLFIIDVTKQTANDDYNWIDTLKSLDANRVTLVLNKIDLLDKQQSLQNVTFLNNNNENTELRHSSSSPSINDSCLVDKIQKLLPNSFKNIQIIENSCMISELESIQKVLRDLVKMQLHDSFSSPSHTTTEASILMNERQKNHAITARDNLQLFINCQTHDMVIAAEHLRRAASSIGRITGHINIELILDSLFANFCIGK